jgi:hypothetical protein
MKKLKTYKLFLESNSEQLKEDSDFISDTCLELDEKGFLTCGSRTQTNKINVVQFGKSPVLKINETTPYFIIGHPRGRYFRFSEIKDELLQIKSYLGERWLKCGVLFESEVERIEVYIDEKDYDHLDDWFQTSTAGIVNLVVFFNI